MTTHNRPGSLLELIASFSNAGVNMTRLESRPARTGQWEYYFYVDIEGHQQDAKVAKALAELKDKAPFVKIFGSYPAAVL
jgi:chorismate mutase/prephenate dehydratase